LKLHEAFGEEYTASEPRLKQLQKLAKEINDLGAPNAA